MFWKYATEISEMIASPVIIYLILCLFKIAKWDLLIFCTIGLFSIGVSFLTGKFQRAQVSDAYWLGIVYMRERFQTLSPFDNHDAGTEDEDIFNAFWKKMTQEQFERFFPKENEIEQKLIIKSKEK